MVPIYSHLAKSRLTHPFSILSRSFFILLVLVAAVTRATADDAQYDRWMEVQTNLQSWTGDFTQTRSLKVLAQPLITPGKVWVRPGEFRWELGQPVQTIVL